MRVFMAFLIFFLNILEALVKGAVRATPPRPQRDLDPAQQVAELQLIRRRRGYKPGWLYYRCRELGPRAHSGRAPQERSPGRASPASVTDRWAARSRGRSGGVPCPQNSKGTPLRPARRLGAETGLLIGVLGALALSPASSGAASRVVRYPTAADFRVLQISLSLPLPPEYGEPTVRI